MTGAKGSGHTGQSESTGKIPGGGGGGALGYLGGAHTFVIKI